MTKAKLSGRSVEDLNSQDRVRVLGIIDKLRELGVNEDISLPQVRPHPTSGPNLIMQSADILSLKSWSSWAINPVANRRFLKG